MMARSLYNAASRDAGPDGFGDVDDEPALPCVEKITFDSLRQAAAAANVAEYQHGANVRPYQCRYCSLWHLASA